MKRLARAAIDILRVTFARDRLEPSPDPSARPSAPRRTVAHLLVAPERLGFEPPGPARARRRWLAWLLAPEALPLDPPRPPRARTRRLGALFARERLDDPP